MTRPRSGLSALKARLDDLVAGARRAFLEEGSHPVTACIYLPGGTPLRFEAPSGSAENLAIVRRLFEMAARGGAEACAVVSEPERSEILIVAIASPAGLLDHRFRIRRAGARVTLEAVGGNAMTFSRFLTDLPWPVGPADTRKKKRP